MNRHNAVRIALITPSPIKINPITMSTSNRLIIPAIMRNIDIINRSRQNKQGTFMHFVTQLNTSKTTPATIVPIVIIAYPKPLTSR
jgi:hypothetical protein